MHDTIECVKYWTDLWSYFFSHDLGAVSTSRLLMKTEDSSVHNSFIYIHEGP